MSALPLLLLPVSLLGSVCLALRTGSIHPFRFGFFGTGETRDESTDSGLAAVAAAAF